MAHAFRQGLADQRRKRPAKLFHRKTRTGCQRCRARRVKCDEGVPVCANCTRLDLECLYGPAKAASSGAGDAHAQNSPHNGASSLGDSQPDPDPEDAAAPAAASLPESEARRKLELDLFYHYFTETGPSIALDDASLPFWGSVACRKALKSDALLYGIYLVSALHRAVKSNFTDLDSMDHCSTYLNMVLHEHGADIARLHAGNVDIACLTSSMLRVYSAARLQHRDLQPYTPPLDWLRMTGTSHVVFREGWELVQDNPGSVAGGMLKLVSHLLEEHGSRRPNDSLAHLLRRQQPHELEEPWDSDIQDVYTSTASYVGAIWHSRDGAGPPVDADRRLIVFPMVVDRRFVALVEEMRPRALVILAHFFAQLTRLRRLWWIGNAGRREVQAIAEAVPPEWRGLLRLPLAMVQSKSLLGPDAPTPP